jgi:hypothetical protein
MVSGNVWAFAFTPCSLTNSARATSSLVSSIHWGALCKGSISFYYKVSKCRHTNGIMLTVSSRVMGCTALELSNSAHAL